MHPFLHGPPVTVINFFAAKGQPKNIIIMGTYMPAVRPIRCAKNFGAMGYALLLAG